MLTLKRQNAVGRPEAIATDDRRGLVVPEHDLVVPGVEGVEVAIQAGAFGHGAEGRLAQAADFAQGMRQVLAQEAVHLEVAAGKEQVFLRKALQFCPQEQRVHRRDDRGLRCRRFSGRDFLAFAATGKQFAAEAQETRRLLVVGMIRQLGRRYGIGRTQADDLTVMTLELAQEEHRPDLGVDEAQRLKKARVAALDPQGKNRGADLAGHAHDLRRPYRVVDATGLQAETGDLARGERQDAAASAQVRQDAPCAGDVAGIGGVGIERIDLDQPGTDARDLAQPAIADDQRVRTGSQQEIHRHQTVGQAMRMIRDDDESSGPRDTRQALITPGIA